MILKRLSSFFDWFEIEGKRRQEIERAAKEAAFLSNGMTHLNDYLALGAILEKMQPRTIFEIGTYKGITSNFFLEILPHTNVLSIAYINPKKRFFTKKFNNSELPLNCVGEYVSSKNKERFTQILGDSHSLIPTEFVQKFGKMDLVFIDGDHTVDGVKKDTALCQEITQERGTICWHDANPKLSYAPVRHYLESELAKPAIATEDVYVGGIACWNAEIETRLNELSYAQT